MYNPNLPQYSMGSWLKPRLNGAKEWGQSNARTIGTIAGGVGGAALGAAFTVGTLGIGAAAIPTLMSAGAAAGGKMGGAVQENYEGDIAADEMQTQMTRDNRRQMAYSQYSPDQTMSGLNNFANGGRLPAYANGGGLFGKNNEVNYDGNTLDEESAYALFTPGRFNQRMLTPGVQRNLENRVDGDFEALNDTNKNSIYYKDPNGNMGQLSPRGGGPIPRGRKNEWMDFVGQFNKKAGEQSQFQLPADRVEPQLKQRAFGGPLAQGEQSGGGLIEYSGQDHNGPDGGIPVDQMGNPSVVSGQEAVGLTEDKESAEGGYVFSENLKPDGKKSFSDLAKELNKRYYG